MADGALQGAKLKGGVEDESVVKLAKVGLFAMLETREEFGWRRMDGRHENGVAGDGKQWQFTTSPASCHAFKDDTLFDNLHSTCQLATRKIIIHCCFVHACRKEKTATPSPRIKMIPSASVITPLP